MPDPRFDVVGIRFGNAGKIEYCHAAGLRLETGEYVIVQASRGPELARVVIAPDQVVVDELDHEGMRPVLRLATETDIRRAGSLAEQAKGILPEARALAAETGLQGHIDHAGFTLDGRRLTFAYTSDHRIDHRNFAREASKRFDVRIEMRSIGDRDRARLAGGYGVCGRELCCSGWLTSFPSISIRMAKEQDRSLNPEKISGLCGRLLCCLSYEAEGYKLMRKTLPKLGQRCSTPTGEGKVIGINVLRRQVTLLIAGQRVEVPDRDLGLVVRWDPSSKAAEPPPSISRAEAIEQGLIEADEQDLLEQERADEPESWAPAVTGAGRLPVRRPPAQRTPPVPEPSEIPEPDRQRSRRGRGRRRGGGDGESRQAGEPQRPGVPRREEPRREPRADLPQGRPFRRAGAPPPDSAAQPPAPREESGGGSSRRRRGRRGGRGRGGGGSEAPPSE